MCLRMSKIPVWKKSVMGSTEKLKLWQSSWPKRNQMKAAGSSSILHRRCKQLRGAVLPSFEHGDREKTLVCPDDDHILEYIRGPWCSIKYLFRYIQYTLFWWHAYVAVLCIVFRARVQGGPSVMLEGPNHRHHRNPILHLWISMGCPMMPLCYDMLWCYDIYIYYVCVIMCVCVYACVFACVCVCACVCSNYLPEYVVSPMTNMCNHDPQMFPVPWQILAEGLRPGHLTDRHAQLTKLLQHRFGLSIQRGCFALGV